MYFPFLKERYSDEEKDYIIDYTKDDGAANIFVDLVYVPMYTRMGPYLFGIMAAFYHLQNPNFTGNFILELLCVGLSLVVNIFGTYPFVAKKDSNHP